VVTVTGGNAGIGYEASRRLAVYYGVRMIMGCRCRSTKGKCDGAAAIINAELKKEAKESGWGSAGSMMPMLADLSSFESIETFVSLLVD
jgi:NAD(P)-dependent dehydrogenase (short-subunit alcohol dehydrogenase family)